MRRSILWLVVVASLSLSGAACVRHMVTMPGQSYRGPLLPVEAPVRAALETTVTHLSVLVGPRSLDQAPAKLAETATWLRSELTAMGYTVGSEPFVVNGVTVENLFVERKGTALPDEVIVVGAHYDSAEGTPGADDNASGVAVALWLAREFSTRSSPRTLRFMFFTNEEPPWFRTHDMGSEHSAALAKERGDELVAVLSLETMGFASHEAGSQNSPWPLSSVSPSTADFIAFVGSTGSRALIETCVEAFREVAKVPSEGVCAPSFVQGIDWSDHGPFARAGYPALMVTDTALFRNQHYHQATDLPPTMDFEFLSRVAVGLEHVVTQLAQ